MAEPDWNEINAKKRVEINLGQAKNQASGIAIQLNSGKFEETYKIWVRKLFKYNCELDDELLGLQSALNSVNKGIKQEPVQKTTGKDKCPKCQKWKPESWKFHQECGWKA